jgi:biopolymer transport protein ExbD
MAIHEPGRRLMRGIELEFVRKKVVGFGGRATNANLSLTSMIDFLVVTVVFLLMTFSASGETPVSKGLTLPRAENTLDMLDAPMVAVNGSQILVDGAPAGNTRAIEESDRLQRVDELFNMLKAKKELWKTTHPGKDFPGVVILQIDQDVKAVVVKSVFQTAAFAGYPNVSFMVDEIAKSGGTPAK